MDVFQSKINNPSKEILKTQGSTDLTIMDGTYTANEGHRLRSTKKSEKSVLLLSIY